MTDPKRELAAIAAEARALLAREVRRGRSHVELAGGEESLCATSGLSTVGEGPRREPEGALRADVVRPSERPEVARRGPARTEERPEVARRGPARAEEPPAIAVLKQAVAGCRKCVLCGTRTQTVFADGSATARLVFVGEAPGRDEDRKGLPFVGRAGQLLDRMIAAIGMRREDVYICNVLKCRPPDNRTPLPEEVEQCLPYLEQQLALVRPALICALGLSALQALLKSKASMASMRGRTFEYKGIPLIPTYHPAALLRNPALKREAWEDMQRVRDTLKAPTGT